MSELERMSTHRTHHTEPSPCPKCGKMMDAATALGTVDGRAPEPRPGDVSLCAYCGEILCFDGDVRLQCAKDEDLASFHPTDVAKLRLLSTTIKQNGEQKGVSL